MKKIIVSLITIVIVFFLYHGKPNWNIIDSIIANENEVENSFQDKKLVDVKDCIVRGLNKTLEIVTWNLEHFPKRKNTARKVADIIKQMNVDVIALQEVKSRTAMQRLIAKLPNWEYVINQQSSINLAFLYNKKTISLSQRPFSILKSKRYALPRSPYVLPIRFKRKNIFIVNNHFKAKGGQKNESRRRKASRLLKRWIDQSHSQDNVVVLGDLNDKITDEPTHNVFNVFLDDADNYKFADINIAKNRREQWSYPSYPSHIDHVLITNELFDNLVAVHTFTLGKCDRSYRKTISDHYPVCVVFE